MNSAIREWLERCRLHVVQRASLEKSAHYRKQYITAVRNELGIGVRELARRMKVSPTYISQLENGKAVATITFNAKLAEFLREEPQWSKRGIALERK